jgi:hypothetical protein
MAAWSTTAANKAAKAPKKNARAAKGKQASSKLGAWPVARRCKRSDAFSHVNVAPHNSRA